MLFYRLWNYLKGYVIINIDSINYEQTINLFKRKKISINDVRKQEKGIQFKIKANDYHKNKELLLNLGINIHSKKGLSFNLRKAKRRIGFIVGLVFLFIFISYIFSFIWEIEIIGNDLINQEEIIQTLYENNINIPIEANNINEKAIENLLYEKYDFILKFTEVYIEGTKLLIYIKEKKEIEYNKEEYYPASIISTKNAVIEKIIVKNGTKAVREGDVVQKGQTLISGVITGLNETSYLVHSDGIVYGRTYYNIVLKENKYQKINVKTGYEKNDFTLYINEKQINIFQSKKKPDKNIVEEKKIEIPIISTLFNMYIIKEKYCEVEQKKVKIDEELLKNKLIIDLYEDLFNKCSEGSRIINKKISYIENDDILYLKAEIEMIEPIGEKVPIITTKEE